MKHGRQAWLWALLPAMVALGATAQAQNYDRYRDEGYNSGPVRCESIKGRTQQCPLQGRARDAGHGLGRARAADVRCNVTALTRPGQPAVGYLNRA